MAAQSKLRPQAVALSSVSRRARVGHDLDDRATVLREFYEPSDFPRGPCPADDHVEDLALVRLCHRWYITQKNPPG
jgi:hypothetical protein